MHYLFIDESSDLGPKGSRYFVMVALLINGEDEINDIVKQMRRNKFKKELVDFSEIKGSKTAKHIKLYTYNKMNEIKKSKIFIVFLDKHYIHHSILQNKRQVYNFLTMEIAKQLRITGNLKVNIDKSNSKKYIQKEFNDYFVKNLINTNLS